MTAQKSLWKKKGWKNFYLAAEHALAGVILTSTAVEAT